ncbi:MAG: bifunctional RNase H/acid phosphatase [Frankiales bacterium]|nr:bifunctional RNase H/acid phosphatase [Frankiales bacterium]
MTLEVIVEADGGSRGNPGPAGYGAVVLEAGTGAVLAERKEFLGIQTNNVAEYRGLIAGLEAAAELQADRVTVRMDSKLVVEQMSGRWQVKHPAMRPLARRASELRAGFAEISFNWIPRAQNKHADRLANEAMDAGMNRPSRTAGPSQFEAPAALASELEPQTLWSEQAARAPSPQPSQEPARQSSRRPESPSPQTAWVPPDSTPTRLILLRHGVTEHTLAKRFAGRSDPALTELGLEQARLAAQRIARLGPIDAVYSSPLRRTRDTAAAVTDRLGLPSAQLAPDFVETDFGDWDGATFAEVAQKWPEQLQAWLDDPAVATPCGESFAAVTSRVAGARDRLLTERAGQSVVVVTHVSPVKVLVRLALDAPPAALHRMFLAPASISVIDYFDDGPVLLRSFNDSAHLPD